MASVWEAAAAGHQGQRQTQHSWSPPAHGPVSEEADGSQVVDRKEGGCAHSPMQAGDWLPGEAAGTIGIHDYNVLKGSWRGYQEQDCICLPCSLSLKISAYSLCWLSVGEGAGVLSSEILIPA